MDFLILMTMSPGSAESQQLSIQPVARRDGHELRRDRSVPLSLARAKSSGGSASNLVSSKQSVL
jgi:hypothetical protein